MKNLKLGKAPAKIDARTIKLGKILVSKNLPPLPDTYDVFQTLGMSDKNVFANDKYGDCVIAARAHMTLAFEKFEVGEVPAIKDQEVVDEYLTETGGADAGLVLLDSLKKWKNEGWDVAGQHYTIHAFASVDWENHDEVKYCIMLLRGIYFGCLLPISANYQFNDGKPWTVDSVNNLPGGWGGHCMYGPSYQIKKKVCALANLFSKQHVTGWTLTGPVVMTWGKQQQMDWNFWDLYVDECFAVLDSKDDWVNPDTDPLDIPLLENILAEITA